MIRGDGPWRAGRSARKWAKDLRRQVSFVRLYHVWILIVPGLIFAARHLSEHFIQSAIALVLLCGFIRFRVHKKHGEIIRNNKRTAKNATTGGIGEKRTAWLWVRRFGLSRQTVYVLHDRSIKEKWNDGKYTAANIDHGLINRSGVHLPDTKVRRGKWSSWGPTLRYQGTDIDTGSISFEAGCVRKALDKRFGKNVIPMYVSWSIWGGTFERVVSGKFFQREGVALMPARKFPRWAKKMPAVLTAKQTHEVFEYLQREFPRR